jgi:phosphoribosylformylglycinamidine synthase
MLQTEIKVTAQVAAEHGLTAEEYARIQKILGREPNITELGIFSVMWSEHCSYKSSRVHLKRLPTRGPQVVQGPGENAGVVDIGDGLVAAFKIESHNHPSFVEPFQGAATGVGGILRDIFTMGARPIAVLDSLRFGPIREELGERGEGRGEEVARNRRILDGVISGIAFYGNCFGVPTVGGEAQFEPCYSANPLVNALALGIAKREELFFARARGAGNPVIYVGAKTGRDGIHGASLLASAEFTEESQQKRPNVQVGDPFMEKLLLEACFEAMKTGAVVAIQDMGAAGLTCSTCEMGSRGGTGIEIELARVPQRETEMTPYEIMLSESQERMLLVAERGREAEVLGVFRKWGLDAVEIGRVTHDGLLRVRHHGQIVAEIPAHALAEEGPVYRRPMAAPAARRDERLVEFVEETAGAEAPDSERAAKSELKLRPPGGDPRVAPPQGAAGASSAPSIDFTEALRCVLASPAVASKRWIFEQYDHMVRTNTLVPPGAGDAAVVRIKGTRRALALATDGNGRWCALNPRTGAMHAVAEAARNVACTGARLLAATNCLNFGSPEKPEVMWQFSEVVDGMAEACGALGVPITGGNVSFYNETLGRSIYPTPVVGVLGVMEDATRALGMGFRAEGDAIVLLDGKSRVQSRESRDDVRRESSSSEYAKVIHGIVAGEPPVVDLEAEKRLIGCLMALAGEGAIRSAHDVSDGGLAVTLAESCFAGAESVLGAEVSLSDVGAPLGGPSGVVGADLREPAEVTLFGERGARAVVSCAPSAVARVEAIARDYGVSAQRIGSVVRGAFRIQMNGRAVVSAEVASLREAWEKSLARALKVQA